MTGVVSASDKKNTSLVEVFFVHNKKRVRGENVFVHNKTHVRGGNALLTKCKKDFRGGSVF